MEGGVAETSIGVRMQKHRFGRVISMAFAVETIGIGYVWVLTNVRLSASERKCECFQIIV